MGKTEDERNLPSSNGGGAGGEAVGASESNVRRGCCGCGFGRISGLVGFRCLFVLILSVAVFLSALFWLPPFRYGLDRRGPDLDPRFRGHEIVASFRLWKPASFLNENVLQLENDIFAEMSYASIKVVILAIDSAGSNVTKVFFGVDADTKSQKIPSVYLSIIRESFESLVINQSPLLLTKHLFGEPFLFEVLKFPGGITVIPPQPAFLLQKVEIHFNFTLNFSIYLIQANFNALTSQLKKGLHLAPYENLYVSLSNSDGSTVSPPTTIQSSVVLRVGTPMPRLKQLAQTITSSHSGNLGLNNTIFGKVKQVRLSSIPRNSSEGSASSPSPSPLPHAHHHQHHHHHHHQHHHHHSPYQAPEVSPSPAPANENGAPPPMAFSHAPQTTPEKAPLAPPPCPFESRRRRRENAREKHSHLAPGAAPNLSPHYPSGSPHQQPYPPAPNSAAKSHLVPAASPLPHVVFAHTPPPPQSERGKQHSNEVASISPSPSSSDVGSPAVQWITLLILIAAGLHA